MLVRRIPQLHHPLTFRQKQEFGFWSKLASFFTGGGFIGTIGGFFVDIFKSTPKIEIDYASSMLKPSISDPTLTRSWTSKLPDDTPLWKVSIPGTHDSGTYLGSKINIENITKLTLWTQCQSWTIRDQLDSGIRYLDLRLNTTENGELMVVHDIVEYHPFSQILLDIKNFMQQNPKEFIIVGFQGADHQKRLGKAIIQALSEKGISYSSISSIPKVQELRGKIWLNESYNIDFPFSTFEMRGANEKKEHDKYWLQNKYEISATYERRQKVEDALNLTYKIVNDKLKYNFMSANYGASFNKDQILKNLENISGTVDSVPQRIAFEQDFTNHLLYNTLGDPKHKGIATGISIMDFPGNKLIQRIINHNF